MEENKNLVDVSDAIIAESRKENPDEEKLKKLNDDFHKLMGEEME